MKRFIFFLLLNSVIFTTASATSFKEGVQYKIIHPSSTITARLTNPADKISVVEFFSYGCPWCFKLDSSLEQWLKTKPSYVVFSRIPVVFEDGWQTYAKAYYTAEALGVLNKITPALFNAIHVKNQNLTSTEAMQSFFQQQGISKNKFENTFQYSPSIAMEMKNGQQLLLAYKVFSVPTIIVGGKYYTNAVLVNGDDRLMMQVVSYLVKKEKMEKK